MGVYENEEGELVVVSVYANDSGEEITQYKTFQNNGVVRVNEVYPDGTKTETFERECVN